MLSNCGNSSRRPPRHAPKPGDARVALELVIDLEGRPQRGVGRQARVGIDAHRPELEGIELAPATAEHAAPVEHGAPARQLDEEREEEHDRRRHDEQQDRGRTLDGVLDDIPVAARARTRHHRRGKRHTW
jgi:hypothetical protein